MNVNENQTLQDLRSQKAKLKCLFWNFRFTPVNGRAKNYSSELKNVKKQIALNETAIMQFVRKKMMEKIHGI